MIDAVRLYCFYICGDNYMIDAVITIS